MTYPWVEIEQLKEVQPHLNLIHPWFRWTKSWLETFFHFLSGIGCPYPYCRFVLLCWDVYQPPFSLAKSIMVSLAKDTKNSHRGFFSFALTTFSQYFSSHPLTNLCLKSTTAARWPPLVSQVARWPSLAKLKVFTCFNHHNKRQKHNLE